EQLAEELDEREDQPRQRALHVFRVRVPARRGGARGAALEVLADGVELRGAERGEVLSSGSPGAPGATAYGGHGARAASRMGATALALRSGAARWARARPGGIRWYTLAPRGGRACRSARSARISAPSAARSGSISGTARARAA